MFEAYRIRPVVEWEGSDESRELEAFTTLAAALEAQARLIRDDPDADFEPRIFWTLYGVNPEANGVRVEDAISDHDSEVAAVELLCKIVGSFTSIDTSGYFLAMPAPAQPAEIVRPFKVRMVWGSGAGGDEKPVRDYEFATQEELDAFLEGCEEANGWLEMERIHPDLEGKFLLSDGR